jgi:acyl dehydratase
MATTLERLLSVAFADQTHTYTEKDVILYALAIGAGSDPVDETQLRFVYEDRLLPLPTLPAILGATRIRDLGLGIDYLKAVHGEQSLVLHRLPPVAGTTVTKTRLKGVFDKGADKGAAIVLERTVNDASGGEPVATLSMTLFARGDGGIGSWGDPQPPARKLPADRPADAVHEMPTLPQAALIYRLSGDLNPLHADPAVARKAGFERPILHGMCTYGVVGYAVVRAVCGGDPARLRSLAGRFSSPAFPGERIQVQMWREPGGVAIRASVPERGAVVFDNGFAELG